jgi:hypothetical protein
VNFTLFLYVGCVAVLLFLLYWALRGSRKLTKPEAAPILLEETGRRHVISLPQIRQALARTDDDFLSERGMDALRQRVRRERRQVVLAYLSALRGDFQSLLRMARVLALLSPEVAALEELERIRQT